MLRRAMDMVGVAVALLTVAPALTAQESDEASPWKLEGEVGASLYFGASDQSTLLLKTGAERTSQRLVFGADGGFEYGEARVLEGDSYVNKRSWTSGLNLDYTPSGRVNPFLSLTGEGSFERRIDLRVSAGVGARYRFVRNEQGRLDLSLAALVERTDPREKDEPEEIETLARWSARVRARRSMRAGGVVFDLVSFYKPAVDAPSTDFTIELTSSLTVALSRLVALKLSLADKYDSLAEDRGARANNDGRVFFSLGVATR